jgi:hypothetical protein
LIVTGSGCFLDDVASASVIADLRLAWCNIAPLGIFIGLFGRSVQSLPLISESWELFCG